MIPGPRPSKGHDRPLVGRDRGHDIVRPLRSATPSEVVDVPSDAPSSGPAGGAAAGLGLPVSLTRTARGWSVLSPVGTEDAADLVEGLSLADLVAEELGALTEPDRTARRSARGPSGCRRGRRGPGRRAHRRAGAHRRPARARPRRPGLHRARHRRPRRAARHQRPQRVRVAARRRTVAGPPGRRSRPRGPRRPGLRDPDRDGGRRAPSGDAPATLAAGPGQRRPGAVVAAVPPPVPRAPAGGPSVGAADGRS